MRTNKKEVLLSDLDSVLNTFNSSWIKLYNEKYNQNLSEEDITEWDIHRFVLPNVNLFEEFIYKNHFFRHLEVQPYAQEVTKELIKYYDIYVVSASHFTTVADKAEWMIEYFPHIPIKQFIPCYYKNMIKGDYLIDDGLHNFINNDINKVLFSKPWNKNYKEYEGNDIDIENIKVINNWIEAYELF